MLLDTVRTAIRRNKLLNSGDTILIGVSGGPDSVALTLVLNSLKKELDLKLHIAHLDHMLRTGSGKDADFVRDLGAKLSIPVTVAQVNVGNLAKEGGSVEELARNARLRFFLDLAKKIPADEIALGHNRDDQAETVLMRILRGTGLYGLSGMIPKRIMANHAIIRPLLDISRREIERYLKRRKITPRVDTSNTDDIYFRNRIRHELLPLLERRYNKNIRDVLATLGESSGCDYDFLMNAAEKTQKPLSLSSLKKTHLSLRRILLRQAIAAVQGSTRRITFKHILELEDLVFNRPVNSIVDLPQGLSAKKLSSSIKIYKR